MSLRLPWSKRAAKDGPWRMAYPTRVLLQTTILTIAQSLLWLFGPGNLFCPRASRTHLVQATLEVHTRTIKLGMPISLARRKDPFHKDLFIGVKSSDDARLTEPVFTHRRLDGSFQVVYNSCPEEDTDSNEKNGDVPRYYGCVARVLSITAAGTQVGGEQTVDFRNILPESRVVGYWTPLTGPVSEHADVKDAIFAVWAAVCPSAAETCKCAQEQCQLSLELHGVKSAFIEYATSSTYTVDRGGRLCSGSDSGANRLGRAPVGRFVYWLQEANGWVCGLADKHGAYVEFDEEHPRGTRVGSIFLLRKEKGAAAHDVTPILAGARLDYPFGFNAVSVGKLEVTSEKGASIDDKHIAVVIRGRYYDEERKNTDPGCFAVARALTRSATQTILKLPCRPCSFAEVLSHPHLEELLPVCEEMKNPRALFVNGQKVAQALKPGHSETVYPESLLPIFIPDDFRSWSIVWRNTTYHHEAPSQSESSLSSILLYEWNQQLQVSSEGVKLNRKVPDNTPNRLYSAPFGKNSLLLAYHEAVGQTAVLEEIALDGRVVNGNSMKVFGNMDGTFLPMSYGDIFMRAEEKVVTWYSLWDDTSLAADRMDSLMPIVQSTRQLRLVRVKESDETRTACTGTFGPANPPCQASCHVFQSYEADTATATDVPSDCPFISGVTIVEPCFDRGCSSVVVESVKAPTSTSAHSAADGNLDLSIRSIGPTPMLEISLRSPSEIWSLRGSFVPHGKTEFNVTVLDQKQATIYTKPTKLSGQAHRGFIFWEWRDVLFFRAQYIRLEVRAEREGDGYLELADFQVKGRELPYCPPEGFFASESHGCGYRLDFLVRRPEIWDCQGHWSKWSYCDSTCRSTRFLTVEQHAFYAGKPCLVFEKKPCSDGPLCNAVDPMTPGGARQSQDCIFTPSEWSECRGCRRLKINHRAREASGNTKAPCPPVVEIEECGPPCDTEFEKWNLRGNSAESRDCTFYVRICDLFYLTLAGTSLLLGVAAALVVARTARRP